MLRYLQICLCLQISVVSKLQCEKVAFILTNISKPYRIRIVSGFSTNMIMHMHFRLMTAFIEGVYISLNQYRVLQSFLWRTKFQPYHFKNVVKVSISYFLKGYGVVLYLYCGACKSKILRKFRIKEKVLQSEILWKKFFGLFAAVLHTKLFGFGIVKQQ